MYKGISESLAVLMGLSVVGTSVADAAPLTGHDITIKINAANSPITSVLINKTVDDVAIEASSADDPFFSTFDFIDISSSIVEIGSGPGGSAGLWDVEIEIASPAEFLFTGSISQVGSFGPAVVQVLSERIIIEDIIFVGGGNLRIAGLSATIDPPSGGVPLPGSMALLGVGLVGIGLRSWDSFLKRSASQAS